MFLQLQFSVIFDIMDVRIIIWQNTINSFKVAYLDCWPQLNDVKSTKS